MLAVDPARVRLAELLSLPLIRAWVILAARSWACPGDIWKAHWRRDTRSDARLAVLAMTSSNTAVATARLVEGVATRHQLSQSVTASLRHTTWTNRGWAISPSA